MSRNLSLYRSVGADVAHPKLLRELADVFEATLIFVRLWRSEEDPNTWRKVNITSMFRRGKRDDPRHFRPANFTLVL